MEHKVQCVYSRKYFDGLYSVWKLKKARNFFVLLLFSILCCKDNDYQSIINITTDLTETSKKTY